MKKDMSANKTRSKHSCEDEADHIFTLFHDISRYFDKVTIQLHTYPNDRDAIERVVSALSSESVVVNWLERHPNSPEHAYDRIQLDLLPHRDKKVFQRVLKALMDSPCFVSISIPYVELACNFLTDNEADAFLIQRFLYEHLYLPRYLASPTWYRDTVYFREQGSTKNYVIYSDRPCKFTGQPCCHLELRVDSTAAMRRLGIHTTDDLIIFDHRYFWDKQIRLLQFRPDKLGKIYCSRHKLNTDKSRYTRVAGILLRADVYDERYHAHNLPIQHLVSKMPFAFHRFTQEISLSAPMRKCNI